MQWIYKGRCWKFGDNLGIDGDILPLRYALLRETRPEVLKEHILEEIDPEFSRKVNPGDVIVAGKCFGQGNPHIYSLIGIKALDVGLVVESIPRGSFRNAINAGVLILPRCPNVTSEVDSGDIIEVNFWTGSFKNLTKGIQKEYNPLNEALLQIIEAGGWLPSFKNRLEQMANK